jgi:hypothetical protein
VLLAGGLADKVSEPIASAAPIVATTRMNSRRSICEVENVAGAILAFEFGHPLNQNLVNE